jgi:L-lactate dehydrogenase
VGYPTKGHPVLIDFCASITTVSKVRELINTDSNFEFPWMLDGSGVPTNDPNVVKQEPMGSILPLGGTEYGYKGYGLGIMVEMLTQGLSGYGRIEAPERWGGNVFLQIIDPEAFVGLDKFTEQVEHFNLLCRNNPPAPGVERVRLPGERCYAHMEKTRATGVPVNDEILARLAATAQLYNVNLPEGREG